MKSKQILCIFSFLIISIFSYGQKVINFAKIDTVKQEVTTYVSLIDIPQGGRARYQQRLLSQAKLVAPPLGFLLWDTNNNIFTIVTANYPKVDTLSFQFVCKINSLNHEITWGESAFMYEDKDKQVQKINIPAKIYSARSEVKDSVVLQKRMFYIQVSASKTQQKISDLSKQVRLQGEHKIIERKTEKYYTYLVGNFPTREAASEKLTYYQQYISDAFIVTF